MHNFVPYKLVLRAAIGNVFGNKSLFHSTYEAYKTVKKKEMEGSAEVIKKMIKKQKGVNKEELLMQTASSFCNPVKAYLDMTICFLLWKR